MGNIASDPQFRDAANDNLRLVTGSPCVDTGDAGSLPADIQDINDNTNTSEPLPLDLDLVDRVFLGVEVDMGAYELSSCAADLSPTCPTPGDCGCGDGVVGPADLAELLANWDPNTTNPCADIAPIGALDGVVGPADLAELLATWGQCGEEESSGFGGGDSSDGGDSSSDDASDDASGDDADDSDDSGAFYEWAMNASIDELMTWLETGQWGG